MNLRQFASNSFANVVTGVFGAIASIAIPFVLARRLSTDEFAVWSVVSQAAGYTALFTIGLQSVVAQRVATALAEHNKGDIDQLLATTLQISGVAAFLYLILASVAAMALPIVYPAIPQELISSSRWSMLAYSIGLAGTILAVPSQGYFSGTGRTLRTARALIPNRVFLIFAAWAASSLGNVLTVAVCLGIVLLAGTIHQLCLLRTDRPQTPLADSSSHSAQSDIRRVVLRDCTPLAIWSIATFLIYGGTTTVVSLFDYTQLPSYALATSVSGLLLGLLTSALAPMIAYVAGQSRTERTATATATLQRFTCYTVVASFLALVGTLALGKPLLTMALPTQYVHSTWQFACGLVASNSIRLLMLPYSNLVVASQQQRRIFRTPIIEATVTFGTAVALVPVLGASGAVIAMVAGSCASILHHFFWNMPALEADLPIDRLRFGRYLLLPSIALTAATVSIWIIL